MRFLSVSKNQLKDLSEILYLPFLVTLNASENQIGSIDFLSAARDSLHYLQAVTLTKNKLTSLPALPCNVSLACCSTKMRSRPAQHSQATKRSCTWTSRRTS